VNSGGGLAPHPRPCQYKTDDEVEVIRYANRVGSQGHVSDANALDGLSLTGLKQRSHFESMYCFCWWQVDVAVGVPEEVPTCQPVPLPRFRGGLSSVPSRQRRLVPESACGPTVLCRVFP
jgi:hypothetical protein